MCTAKVNLTILLSIAMLLTLPLAAFAAGEDDASPKFHFHGFLTQAWADASFTDGGPRADEVIIGIPEDGTTEYRFLAIQFRYQITPKDIMVVQLSNRALGDSPIGLIEDDIELDWAFYERRLADVTSIKVGRIQIPLGIFNEFRDVGTLLPFYRPPFTFYREGSFTSETVDGALFSHIFFADKDWNLNFDFYAGEWELVEADVFDITAPPKIANAEDAYGVQLWLHTPVTGLRIGAGYQKRDITGGQEGIFRPVGESSELEDYYYSLEYVRDKFVLRAESRTFGGDVVFPQFQARAFTTISYAQVGFHIHERFRIYLQSELAEINQHGAIFTEDISFDFRTDNGIAINYLFTPNIVLKGEYHEIESEESQNVPTPNGLMPVYFQFDNGSYTIVSLAVSF